MKLTAVSLISATLVASAPVPGVLNALAAPFKALGSCIGSCTKAVDNVVTVEIPAAVHGLGDGIGAAAKVGRHEAGEGAKDYAKALREEKEKVAAARKAEREANKAIAANRHAQHEAEEAEKRAANLQAWKAMQAAEAERAAAFEDVEAEAFKHDQAAYEAYLASEYEEENAKALARATREAEVEAAEAARKSKLDGFLKDSSSDSSS